ncbi:MAG: hypothetical protein M1821_008976 [Bathelium mastoideum]|nr:MAG: hypothetical protein M1821_008976 [Bathelium mastoideum]
MSMSNIKTLFRSQYHRFHAPIDAHDLALRYDVAELLLKYGVDKFQLGFSGISPATHLEWFCSAKPHSSEAARFKESFFEDGDDTPLASTALHKAIFQIPDHELAAQLENFYHLVNVPNSIKRTPLMVAARMNKSRCVQKLLKLGADVKLYEGSGFTALHSAVNGNAYDCAKMLLDAGANVEGTHSECGMLYTPLSMLVTLAPQPIEATLDLLIKHGANVDVLDIEGFAPLTWAAAYRSPKVVEILIRAGADIETIHRSRASPLFWAFMATKPLNVTSLLRSGAVHDDESTMRRYGLGVLHFVALLGSVEVMEAVRSFGLRGVDIGAKDRQGLTPWEIFAAIRPVFFTKIRKESANVAEPAFRALLGGVSHCLEPLYFQPDISSQEAEGYAKAYETFLTSLDSWPLF